jgi:DNA-binding beta-propeller fold protein YncE
MTSTTWSRPRLLRLGLATALGAGALLAAPSMASATPAQYVVVADHLANPRGLFIAKGSEDLYFSQSGYGGGNAKVGVQLGTGQNGSVSVAWDADSTHPGVQRIASHLWSATLKDEGQVATLGAAGLTKKHGQVYVAMSEAFQKDIGPQPQEGRLLKVSRSGVHAVADIATASLKWEATRLGLNTQFPDTNPYGVTVFRHGSSSTLYVTTLALVDGPGAARIFRIDPTQHHSVFTAAKVWATGLTAMNGCAFSPDGKYFYVSELLATETLKGAPKGLPPAAVVKVPFAHPNSGRTYLGLSFLHFAGGVAVDRDGHVYVANFTNQPAGAPIGQVLRLDQ